MAKIWDVFKTFRPRTTILSDDFNSFQTALSEGFDKLGTEAPSGLLGVGSPFAVGPPTDPKHAISKAYFEANLGGSGSPSTSAAEAAASALAAASSASAAAASAASAATSATLTSTLRFSDAYYLAFFFGEA